MGTSLKGVGIPIKLLHEAAGHVVTVELKSGETFRGELFECEDNWNCQLRDVTATARDGRGARFRPGPAGDIKGASIFPT